jgi:hypothetical protein
VCPAICGDWLRGQGFIHFEAGNGARLKTAATLPSDLDGRIILTCLQVVPYPLSLERPPVSIDFLAERLRAAAAEAGVPVKVQKQFAWCALGWLTIPILMQLFR